MTFYCSAIVTIEEHFEFLILLKELAVFISSFLDLFAFFYSGFQARLLPVRGPLAPAGLRAPHPSPPSASLPLVFPLLPSLPLPSFPSPHLPPLTSPSLFLE